MFVRQRNGSSAQRLKHRLMIVRRRLHHTLKRIETASLPRRRLDDLRYTFAGAVNMAAIDPMAGRKTIGRTMRNSDVPEGAAAVIGHWPARPLQLCDARRSP